MASLNIQDRRERALVRSADALLQPLGWVRRRRPRESSVPARILALRLERIGDLVMVLPALALLRACAPDASIDLAVGSWNAGLARSIPEVDRVLTMDAGWLAREPGGLGLGLGTLIRRARAWKSRRYDLAINFEPDLRSNLVLAASGARRRVGYASGGGGALLDTALDYDVRAHTTDNAVRLVRAALGTDASVPAAPLGFGALSERDAERRLAATAGTIRVGVHAGGGRAIKQWPTERFAELAQRLAARGDVQIVLTGTAEERTFVDRVKAALPADRVIDVSGDLDLVQLGAVLSRLDLFITGDTGPMHLAAAAGTPIVAIFGPSDPVRYAPRGPLDRIVRIDLPCSPCNRIRQPPARCVGHTPDCLEGIGVDAVLRDVEGVLSALAAERRGPREASG